MRNHHKILLKIISIVLMVEGALMLIPSACGVYYHQTLPAKTFAECAAVYIIIGMAIYQFVKVNKIIIKNRDGFLIGIASWFIVCLAGAVPIYFTGSQYTVAMAIFESVAGWTTTGAWTIMPVDVSKSLIMWKAINNWIGGIGVLILAVYLFPTLGAYGQKLKEAESNEIQFSKMSAKLQDTPRFSLYLYIILSAIELCMLIPSGLPFFDAVVNTMSSIGTAGLINMRKVLVINYSPYVKFVISLFTVLGSVNIMMYFLLVTGKVKQVLRNTELRMFIGLILGSGAIMGSVMVINHTYDSVPACYVNALVQACSYSGTSGFWVDDINTWPTVCIMILVCLVIIGACSNSTGGSLKVIRFIVYMKLVYRGIYKRIHPRSVKPIMIEGKPVSAKMASSITVFILLFFMMFIFSSVILSLEDLPLESTLSAALACMTNNGTGIGAISQGFYGDFSSFGLLFCSLLMLAGRLEFYAVIMLFSRSFWNHDRASY